MNVFFYGLFMDESLLASKGIKPSGVTAGYLKGFGPRIGERATLVRDPEQRAYGTVMDITTAEAGSLYSEASVADYVAERVIVELGNGERVEASCYKLPAGKITGANRDYADSLLAVASSGLLDEFLPRANTGGTMSKACDVPR